MISSCPVIIVGTPRSGTSLLQKIVREHDGFCSVAKESGFIWRTLTHPERNGWRYEGWTGEIADQRDLEAIRTDFDRYALSASTWRRVSALNVMRYQRSRVLAPILRAAYHLAAVASRPLRRNAPSSHALRLVDKSVHFPLFLPLVEQVFPDARYIHIVRDGRKTVPSMLEGWLNPARFFTYEVPGGLAIPDYPHRYWNFALPEGWEEWRKSNLADVVAFQWIHLQEAVIEHFRNRGPDQLLRIRLEDLTASPGPVLDRLTDFLDLPPSVYFDNLSKGLPLVNARPQRGRKSLELEVERRMERLSAAQSQRLDETNRRIGYP